MTRKQPVVFGNILKTHYHWVLAHTYTDEKGQLRCSTSNEPVYAEVHHYVRPLGSNAHHPFTETIDARDGEILTFKSYGLNKCKASLPVPAEVYFADVMIVR